MHLLQILNPQAPQVLLVVVVTGECPKIAAGSTGSSPKNGETGRVYCGNIVGMVSILFTVSTAEGGRAAWLEDLIVHPVWRGQGVGRQLLDQAIGEAKAAGCLRVTLLTDQTNEAAMKFYRRAGFGRSGMTPFRLRL